MIMKGKKGVVLGIAKKINCLWDLPRALVKEKARGPGNCGQFTLFLIEQDLEEGRLKGPLGLRSLGSVKEGRVINLWLDWWT